MKVAEEQLREVFEVGGSYTIYRIGEMMAMTVKQEITVKRFQGDDIVVYVNKGKRKEFGLRLKSRAYQSAPELPFMGMILKGWEQPIKCDTEKTSGIMRGNACYNFMGKPEEIRKWIDENQLNPFFEKCRVVAIEENVMGDAGETVVYPELVQTGRNAVIDRLMSKSA